MTLSDFCIHGVSAIIPRVINEKKHILIQKRQKGKESFETGLIEVPCGKVKKQESVFECLYNKVQVETGLKITKIYGENKYGIKFFNHYEVVNYIPFFSSQNIRGNYPIVIDTFICETEGEPVTESLDAKDIRWVSLYELNNMLQKDESLFYPMVVMPLKRFIDMQLGSIQNFV